MKAGRSRKSMNIHLSVYCPREGGKVTEEYAQALTRKNNDFFFWGGGRFLAITCLGNVSNLRQRLSLPGLQCKRLDAKSPPLSSRVSLRPLARLLVLPVLESGPSWRLVVCE